MRTIMLIIVLAIHLPLWGQNFIASLYFEDALGNKDTLMFGRTELATYDMDEQLGEIDIQGEALDELDVRFFRLSTFNTIEDAHIGWSCFHQDGDVSVNGKDFIRRYIYESKVSLVPLRECTEESRGYFQKFIIPTNAAFPITIKWDQALFRDSCNNNANISENPFYFQGNANDDFCPERINYSFISLNELDSIVLEQPNFLTFLRADSTLVSPYYIRVPHRLDGEITINTNNVLKNADLQIHPNPVQDILYLETADQNWSYQILNLQGQQVSRGKYENSIDVIQLPSGIYFLQLMEKGNLYKAIKFVKQ